jgi:hypothetical protein
VHFDHEFVVGAKIFESRQSPETGKFLDTQFGGSASYPACHSTKGISSRRGSWMAIGRPDTAPGSCPERGKYRLCVTQVNSVWFSMFSFWDKLPRERSEAAALRKWLDMERN